MAGIQQVLASLGGSTPSTTYATWDPAFKGANMTLSGGNLTAYNTSNGIVRSTIGKSTGKWYWELTATSSFAMLGVCNSSEVSSSAYVGQTTNAWGIYAGDGGLYTNAAYAGIYCGTFSTGNIIAFALDADAKTVNVYLNNVYQSTITLTGTTFYAECGINASSAPQNTANFGASALTYTPPSGYASGLYT